jgi:hypothetical protein
MQRRVTSPPSSNLRPDQLRQCFMHALGLVADCGAPAVAPSRRRANILGHTRVARPMPDPAPVIMSALRNPIPMMQPIRPYRVSSISGATIVPLDRILLSAFTDREAP